MNCNRLCKIVLIFCISITAYGQYQNPSDKIISISCKQMPIKEVLDILTQKAGVTFTYSNDLIALPKQVTIQVTNQTLGYVLNQILKDTNIEYKVIGNQVIFQTKPAPPRKYTISGYIREDGSGELLTGVNVYLLLQKTGTVSNTYGFYSLTLPGGDSITLIYSFVGYGSIV